MERQRLRILTNDQIQEAERLRTRGRVSHAAGLMKPGEEIPRIFPALSSSAQIKVLMSSRIHVNSEVSLAKKSLRANSVAAHLGEARTTIERIYRDQTVESIARRTTHDTFGNPYEFATEMARDEVNYVVTLARLTGNTAFLTSAIERLNSLMEHSQEPTVKTLVRFEQAELLDRQRLTTESFSQLRTAYQEAVDAAYSRRNWERVGTVASRYAITAFKRKDLHEAIQGVSAWVNAAKQDRNVTTILPREIYKKATQGVLEPIWRRTIPHGVNYASLAL